MGRYLQGALPRYIEINIAAIAEADAIAAIKAGVIAPKGDGETLPCLQDLIYRLPTDLWPGDDDREARLAYVSCYDAAFRTVLDRSYALVKALNLSSSEIQGIDRFIDGSDEPIFTFGGAKYLVLTKEETAPRAWVAIKANLWVLPAYFLADHIGPNRIWISQEDLDQVLVLPNRPLVNQIVESLVKDFDTLVEAVISKYGRGPFLAEHDGIEETEMIGDVEYFLYRLK
jgi:hypothetical protein